MDSKPKIISDVHYEHAWTVMAVLIILPTILHTVINLKICLSEAGKVGGEKTWLSKLKVQDETTA